MKFLSELTIVSIAGEAGLYHAFGGLIQAFAQKSTHWEIHSIIGAISGLTLKPETKFSGCRFQTVYLRFKRSQVRRRVIIQDRLPQTLASERPVHFLFCSYIRRRI